MTYTLKASVIPDGDHHDFLIPFGNGNCNTIAKESLRQPRRRYPLNSKPVHLAQSDEENTHTVGGCMTAISVWL